MAATPAYDLMILVDSDAPEEARARVVDDIKKQIAGGEGELKGDADWGVRKLAYEIDHRTEAYYHLFQLEAAPALLSQLDHSLSINDQVLRHRVIKLPKGAPEKTPRPEPAPPRYAESGAEAGAEVAGEARPAEAQGEAAPAEPASEAAPVEPASEAAPVEAAPRPAEGETASEPAEQAPS